MNKIKKYKLKKNPQLLRKNPTDKEKLEQQKQLSNLDGEEVLVNIVVGIAPLPNDVAIWKKFIGILKLKNNSNYIFQFNPIIQHRSYANNTDSSLIFETSEYIANKFLFREFEENEFQPTYQFEFPLNHVLMIQNNEIWIDMFWKIKIELIN